MTRLAATLFLLGLISSLGCASDADDIGVGAECVNTEACPTSDDYSFVCITRFTGGYCGIDACVDDADCPPTSACVIDDDGGTYCTRLCEDKVDCNANRSVDNEANCVGSITFVDGDRQGKACEPSSSGI